MTIPVCIWLSESSGIGSLSWVLRLMLERFLYFSFVFKSHPFGSSILLYSLTDVDCNPSRLAMAKTALRFISRIIQSGIDVKNFHNIRMELCRVLACLKSVHKAIQS